VTWKVFDDSGSGILLTDMDVGNAGVAGAFTCRDPREIRKRRDFF
jgi:hypothetical protein